MSELDDLFRQEAKASSSIRTTEQPFDKEAWVQKKQELRQWTYETIDATTLSVMQSGEAFQKYLDVQSRFDRYSVANALLILAQLKALYKDAWESIVGNCDVFLYLGGNEQSTHKYDLLRHPNIELTTDGQASPFQHGGTDYAIDWLSVKLHEDGDYELLAEDEVESLFLGKE